MAIAYLNEHEDAQATQAAVEKEGRRAILLPGDVADPAYARHPVAQPEEIAPAFVFLASPQMSSYITGEILPIIGGY